MPSGPGNMSGKIVSTVARHMLALAGAVAACRSTVLKQFLRHVDDEPATGKVDHRYRRFGERDEHGRPPGRGLHLDQVASAVVLHRGYGADLACVALDPQPDQV